MRVAFGADDANECTAAVLALNGGTSVQGVSYTALQQRLIADGVAIISSVDPIMGEVDR